MVLEGSSLWQNHSTKLGWQGRHTLPSLSFSHLTILLVGLPIARGQVKPVSLAVWGIESEESSLPRRERVEENSREWI